MEDYYYRINDKPLLQDNAVIPIIEIAVIYNSLKHFQFLLDIWFNVKPYNLILDNVYSKIFWLNENPIQIIIHQIYSKQKFYHCIIHLTDNNSFNKISLENLTYETNLVIGDYCMQDINQIMFKSYNIYKKIPKKLEKNDFIPINYENNCCIIL